MSERHAARPRRAWRRWTKGLGQTVIARCEAAGLGRLRASTWEALLLDAPMPAEAAALVADIAALPFSPKRYQAVINRAVTRSMIMYSLAKVPELKSPADPYKADNIAGIAAQKIWAQRDRVAAGEIFERRHDAEFVHEAALEYEAREQLRADGWREPRLDTEARRLVEIAMRDVRGSYGRPSDEYPTAARVEVGGLRIAQAPPEEQEALEDEAAQQEAAEHEAAPNPRKGRAA